MPKRPEKKADSFVEKVRPDYGKEPNGGTFEEQVAPKKDGPEMLFDNGHGVRVKQWTNNGKYGNFTNLSIERSLPDGSGGWQKHTVRIEERDYAGIADAITKAKEIADQKKAAQKQGGQER